MSPDDTKQPTFPRRRADGSFSVSARLAVPSVASRKLLEEYVDAWPSAYEGSYGIRPEHELFGPPRLVVESSEQVQVVFDGRPESRVWKDLMVNLVQHIPPNVGAEFLGFHDLVAGEVHPGSVN